MKHFELLKSETKVNAFGITLCRIRCTVAIESKGIKVGDLGGWVESEDLPNGNARVSGDARVYGDAWVYGNAQVYGNAWEISPLQIVGTRHFVNFSAKGQLQIGCHVRTPEEWLSIYERVGRSKNYNESQIQEYKLYIQLAAEWHKIYADQIED